MHLLEVLRALVADRRDLTLSAFSARRIEWALASGLGPAMFRAVEADPRGPATAAWAALESADLTARVLAAHQTAALLDVVDACTHRDVPVVVLKGMSVSQAYPSAHLRPMRDIDVLVPPHLVSTAIAACRRLGYVDDPAAAPGEYDQHHHATPLVHQRTGIWLEIHHRLFPAAAGLSARGPFDPDRVGALTVTTEYHGRSVGRLSGPLEVAYLASHWARSGKPIAEPGGATGLLDVAMLAKTMTRDDWSRACAHVQGSEAARHLELVTGYLGARHLLPGEWPACAGRRETRLPRLGRQLAHAIIDRHVIDGWRPGGRTALRAVERFWAWVLRPPTSVAA